MTSVMNNTYKLFNEHLCTGSIKLKKNEATLVYKNGSFKWTKKK